MSTRLVRKPTVVAAAVDADEVVPAVVVVDVATNLLRRCVRRVASRARDDTSRQASQRVVSTASNQYRKTAILAVFSRAGSPCYN